VYLEGVCVGTFKRDLKMVRAEPERLSLEALAKAKGSVGSSPQFSIVESLLPVLEGCIRGTPVCTDIKNVRQYLALLDTNLTFLNRLLDPESDHSHRWWR